jgi:hypothetical protein
MTTLAANLSPREVSRLADLIEPYAELHERLAVSRHATDAERREYVSDAALLRVLCDAFRLDELASLGDMPKRTL